MVKMSEICPESYTPCELKEFRSLTERGVLALFIYNKNIYYEGRNFQIDSDNCKVRTEIRSGISFAPVSVFTSYDGGKCVGNSVCIGGNVLNFKAGCKNYTVNGKDGEFASAPFELYGHTYVPVIEVAEALGLASASYYHGRLTVIGDKEAVGRLDVAVKKNRALEDAGAAAVVGMYDAEKFTHEDFVIAKDKWRQYLVASPETIDTTDAGMMAKVNSIANHARHLMNTMNREDGAVILWGKDAPNESEHLQIQYSNIRALALAWGTYGSDLYHNEDLKNDILYALEWMYQNMYGEAELEDRGWRSFNAFNWWHWYVGAPDELTDTLLIMENCITEEQKRNYMKVFKYLLDHWRLTYSQNECSGRMAVGTKCALLLEDPERLAISANDYHVMLDVTLEGPGTHTDYCNYQHGLPYNMCYGKSNLHRVLKVGAILSGTPLEFSDERQYNQFMVFKYMFEAAMYRGRGYNCFNGRGCFGDELGVGLEVVRYIIPMIGNYGEEEDAAIKHFIKYTAISSGQIERVKSDAFVSSYSTLMEILNDESIPSDNDYECTHAWFSADRATQHKNDYAFALSMPSYRHVSYESINHLNHTGWYMNDGTLYLYTNNDQNAFDGPNFVLNKRLAHRMPGTTVDVRPRPEVSISEGWIPKTEKVGCMQFDGKYIIAGMDYECYNMEVGEDDYVDTGYGGGNPRFPNDLVARKAYFMFDDECVCLGAGITSTMNADVNTIVEHRRLVQIENDPKGADKITVNGADMPHDVFEMTFENPSYARVEGFAGFIFADAPKVSVSKYMYAIDPDKVKGNVYIPEYAKNERPFVEMMINHGANPNGATYAYAVLPYADDEKLAKYAADPDFEVISNTSECQAVREKNINVTGIVFYEAGECARIKADRPCLVTFSDEDGEFKIKICEPTNKTDEVKIEISRKLKLISADSRYTVECADTTKIVLDVSLSAGEAYEAVFVISEK